MIIAVRTVTITFLFSMKPSPAPIKRTSPTKIVNEGRKRAAKRWERWVCAEGARSWEERQWVQHVSRYTTCSGDAASPGKCCGYQGSPHAILTIQRCLAHLLKWAAVTCEVLLKIRLTHTRRRKLKSTKRILFFNPYFQFSVVLTLIGFQQYTGFGYFCFGRARWR